MNLEDKHSLDKAEGTTIDNKNCDEKNVAKVSQARGRFLPTRLTAMHDFSRLHTNWRTESKSEASNSRSNFGRTKYNYNRNNSKGNTSVGNKKGEENEVATIPQMSRGRFISNKFTTAHNFTRPHSIARNESKNEGGSSKNYVGRSKYDNSRNISQNFNNRSKRSRSVNLPFGKSSESRWNPNAINQIQLQELEQMDPENMIIYFSKNSTVLEKLLNETYEFNIVVLFLQIISKLCNSSFNEYKSNIIVELSNTDFLQKLQNYIFILPIQDESEKIHNLFFWKDQKRFWNDLLNVYNTIFKIVPKTACEKLPKMIKGNMIVIENLSKDNTKTIFDDEIKALELLHETIVSEKEIEKPRKRFVYPNPKDNFRNIDVYPSVKEITSREYPFIQRIIKGGGYDSVEQYLNIHFRLLREDFVSSLRNGICTYLENQTSKDKIRQFDVRIYENVKFIRPHVVHDRVGILVNYTSKPKKDMISENKHFMYGALVCFTNDNFQSFIYGTVVDSDPELLKRGFIAVDVADSIIYEEDYVMIESSIFFEPYHQVLKALQNMTEENFPMKKYIIDVNSTTEHPKYLTLSTQVRIERMRNIFPEFSRNNILLNILDRERARIAFNMLSIEQWPPATHFELNQSQYKAFQTALTNEFSVIQGPPGTGKTYTSLKIVDFLLKHKKTLTYSGPILVICYTNHALDQFLEGILKFSEDIVRIGSQSKNEKIKPFNLKQCRHEIKPNTRGSYYESLLYNEKEKVDQYVQKVECLQNLLEDITCKKGIINFNLFKKIDGNLRNTWFDHVRPHLIVNWLLEGWNTYDIEEIQELHTVEPEDLIQHELYSKANELDRNTRIIDDTEHYNSHINFINNCILTVSEISNDISELRNFIFYNNDEHEIRKYETAITKLNKKKNYLLWRLNHKEVNNKLLENIDYNNPYKLSPNQRWNLYRHWVHLLRMRVHQDIAVIDEEYRAAKRRFNEVQQMVDVYVMRQKSVIGMTTTAAAKHQPVLQALKCKIVIVEEAAEILESHVIAALTKDCQQLILIGDHLQLRPSTSQYYLAKHFNLEISLFERMVINGIQCQQLEVQHRMRPEFSKLITPTIYSNLADDVSVFEFPPIRGVTKNLFFITHNEFEDNMYNSTSHKNIYEAKYLLNLALYLVKQGYSINDITILTTYTGQMFTFWRECKNFPGLEGIKMTVVDNFQGEENKIILLSLVRSNEDENIGFLKIENRVCVALSRAKEGFFMIGNMDNLEKSSAIWPKIKEVLVKQNSIGPVLTLKCRNHNNDTNIETYTDFNKVPEGGCNLVCEELLSCGHTCLLKCHPYDRDHFDYKCTEFCERILCDLGHVCPKICGNTCGKCVVRVEKSLPCGHSNFIPCSTDPKNYNCPTEVEATLPCKHTATKSCWVKPEDAKCPHPCEAILKCGHTCKRLCHIKFDPDHKEYECREPCEKFKNGCSTQTHKCQKQCSEACEPCTEKIKKKRTSCTHMEKVACNFDLDKQVCKEKCRRLLPCGHHCPEKCFMPCGNCKVKVDKTIETCGHTEKIRCGSQPEKKLCTKKCSLILDCGHPCQKLCSETCVCTKKCMLPVPNDTQDNITDSIASLFDQKMII